jgi:recombinational DNA repair ATPase RecF
MEHDQHILQIENLSKYFGGLAALSNCSLKIKKGSITGIIGPNGSGKTSILEAICFLTTGKSFRKKHAQSIIKKGKKELQIQAKIINKEEKKLTISKEN